MSRRNALLTHMGMVLGMSAVALALGRQQSSITPPTPMVVEDELTKSKTSIAKDALALLASGHYSELDALAANFRQSQQSFENGYWKLTLFYQSICDLGNRAPESEWQSRLSLIRRWFEQETESITPRVAMAEALVSYAWHARGHGWASKVPEDAWPSVYERIAEASRILEAATNLTEKCPCWYSTRLRTALLAGRPREQYETMFDAATAAFPTYAPLYFIKTNYLLERWYGKPGEWEAFAGASADKIGGENGDVLYAQILWYVHDLRIYGNPISESAIKWERARRGFEALHRRFPGSIFALSEFCSISGFAPTGARQLMRNLFAELGNRVDLAVWRETELFLRDWRWAHSD